MIFEVFTGLPLAGLLRGLETTLSKYSKYALMPVRKRDWP